MYYIALTVNVVIIPICEEPSMLTPKEASMMTITSMLLGGMWTNVRPFMDGIVVTFFWHFRKILIASYVFLKNDSPVNCAIFATNTGKVGTVENEA